ncbi:MAG: SurA N-terminal domain-containing protein [Nitrosomonadaceae bacterium]|nr:SurA N-terminal domain-containing protein [Nitrosospira sp.]MDW7565001.1 SurA N-terminal domain-containing protein [Nitrosomonadaceae bacterium]MBI0408465.1 SurA N-terminal domain-containing protein [Nitrosospira sp.]MBI0410827.1 SurA N-terminal domain-containing protein [Nitrosospira sp.]MBI0411766.1 SurA N-terminal domain-containing protein [Nitrosospira sp.]
MFDFVHRKKGVVQFILVLATLPFLFWGVESYRSDGEDHIAIVAGEKILRQELDQAMRNQQEIMRGAGEDPSMLDNPEERASVLKRLIQNRLLKQEAARIGLTVLDPQLVDLIQGIGAFQQDGAFSKKSYEELLRDQGMTPLVFEERVRQEMLQQQLIDAYTRNGFVPDTVAERVLSLSEEKREVSMIRIQPEQFLAQMRPNDAAIKSYYDLHQTEFQVPEQVRVEYLVLSLDELAKQIRVEADETRKYFEEHKDGFGRPEERQASHILISVATTASDAEKAAARAKAEQLLAQIKQTPKIFADLARQQSQDPGSAVKGGDLGFFGRGMMVKSFEDAVFQMKLEEVRGPIQTDFGFHIIKLSAIKLGVAVNFDDVKHKAEQELKKQKAEKAFGEMAEGFGNSVYEQSDSLQPAAEKFKLSVRQSDWISRKAGELPFLTNGKLLQAIFSEDAIKNKRNTEVVEVTPNTLVVARVLNHRPSSLRSMAAAKDEITMQVIRQQAAEAAVKDGREKLERLQKGESVMVAWGPTQLVSRQQSQGIENKTLRAIFKAGSNALPSYSGETNTQDGFTLIRISLITEPASADEFKRKAFGRQLQQLLTQEELSAALAGIRQRSDVTIKQ